MMLSIREGFEKIVYINERMRAKTKWNGSRRVSDWPDGSRRQHDIYIYIYGRRCHWMHATGTEMSCVSRFDRSLADAVKWFVHCSVIR